MKKALFTLALGFVATGLFGQGTVVFQNSSASAVQNQLTGTTVGGGTAYMVQLFSYTGAGTDPAPAPDNLAPYQSASTAINFIGAGRFSGGSISTPVAVATTTWWQVRAWSSALGADWNTAYAAWIGGSGIGTVDGLAGWSNPFAHATGNPSAQPPVPGTALTEMQSFAISPVPEPGVLALGAVGLVALLWRRRK